MENKKSKTTEKDFLGDSGDLQELFETFAKQEHWSHEKQLEIVMEYIDNQKCKDAFVDFLEQYVKDYRELKR